MAAITPSQGVPTNGFVQSFPPSSMGGEKSAEGATPASSASREQEEQQSQSGETSPASTQALTERDLKLIQELKKADTEVRAHEMAHIAAGGQYITSGAKLEYQRGPDGVNYAVAGEVSIDTSAIPGDPRATAQKMQRIKAAALAPASPSAQDRKVAASATALAAKAAAEIMALVTAQSSASAKDGTATAHDTGTAATAYANMASETPSRGTGINISA